jgi:hypothetical protein
MAQPAASVADSGTLGRDIASGREESVIRTASRIVLASLTACLSVSLLLLIGLGRVEARDMTVEDDILYLGPEVPDARLDVYLPVGVEPPYPTVVSVAPPVVPDEGHMSFYAPRLTEQGYAAVGVRTRTDVNLTPDSFCAVAWIHAHAADYGFDPDRIVAFGISSSAFPMATIASLDREADHPFMDECPYEEPAGSWVAGVVSYEGMLMTPVSLGELDVRIGASQLLGLPLAEVDGLFDLLIETPPERWRGIEEVDPIRQRIIQGFPLSWIDGSEPPFLLVNGAATDDWFDEDQRAFAAYLEAAGVPVEVVEKAGLAHAVTALAGHTEEMDAFLSEVFGESDPVE